VSFVDIIKNKIGLQKWGEAPDSNDPFKQPQHMPFNNKEESISFVKQEFERRQELRRPIELQWHLNMNFLMGNQYCDINLIAQEVQQVDKLYDWQEREVYNHIAPIYETRLAKLKRVRPIPLVRPATSESNDVATAKVCTSIAKGIEYNQSMNEKRSEATAWAEICGCCFYKDVWDTKAGRLIGEFNGEKIYEGDLKKIIVSPFEFFPDNNFARGIEGCRSIIHARAFHVDEIYDTWRVEVQGRNIDVFSLSQTNIGTGGLGYNATIYKFASTVVENHEIVIEYMSLPCKKFPKGVIIIVAGDKLLYYGDFIYKVGDNGSLGFPFTMQICIENPGHFWPTSIIERLIPIQRSYNAVKNRKHEILNRKAIGVLAVEDDGNTDTEDLEEEGLYPGKILVHARGTKKPEFLESRDSTTDFDQEEASLRKEFEEISGVSPFSSQSLPPSGVNSGIAMEKIREQDDTRIGLTAENINAAAIKSCKIDLRMCKQFAKGPRLLRYAGENNDIQLIEWYASDITSDDVIIEKEDELAQTPAQQRQMVIDLLQYRLFEDPDTGRIDRRLRSKIFEALKLGNWEDAADIDNLQITRAMRENKFVENGVLPVVKDYDDHAIHIQEHNRFRLDVRYEQIEQQYPDVAMAFDLHVKQHKAMIQAQVQQAMLKAAASEMTQTGGVPNVAG